jgi:hypothetical protein
MTLVVVVVALLLSIYSLYPSRSAREHGVRAVLASAPAEASPLAGAPARAARLRPAREAVTGQAATARPNAPEPLELRCVVLDEDGRGVPQAEIWVDDGSYSLRGQTDPQGALTLALEEVAVRARWHSGAEVLVGARHPDHGPSLLRAWSSPSSEPLILSLRGRGASLRLRIVDPAGLPIAGAAVGVAPDRSAPFAALSHDGLPARITPSPALVADGGGEVFFEGLEPGPIHVGLSGQGFCARSVGLRLVEGSLTERSLTLSPAASVRGRLTCLDGRVPAAARVLAVGANETPLVETLADATGEFELSEVPAGLVRLRAELRAAGELSHAAGAEVLLRAGVTTTWDVTLMPIDSLRGQLLSAAGEPLAGWRLELQRAEGSQEPLHIARTDEAGRYELPLPDTTLAARLLLYHPRSLGGIPTRVFTAPHELEDIELQPGEERSSSLRGHIRRPDGRPAGLVPFLVHRLGTGHHLSLVSGADGGSFETPPLPPGDYVLLFPTHGRGWLPNVRYEVGASELLDIGSVRLPELGLLELLPSIPTRSSECRELKLSLQRPDVGVDFSYVVHEGRTDLPVSLGLAPGLYSLQLLDSVPPQRLELTVAPGSSTDLTVPSDL